MGSGGGDKHQLSEPTSAHSVRIRMMKKRVKKRLDPEERKAAILQSAKALLSREGLDGFSLEAVAREAGVALSLPRHYFGSYRDLLKAATEDVLKHVETLMLDRTLTLSFEARFSAYLEVLEKNPWGHVVWMRSAELHPDIHAVVRNARTRMGEAMYRRPWDQLSLREQLDARGRIGYIEAIVSEWHDQGFAHRELFVDLIVSVIFEPARAASMQKAARVAS